MSAFLVLTLSVLTGVIAYAALHNGVIGLQRPVHRPHLLFACLCVTITVYVSAKTGAYRAESATQLVAMRRLELSASTVFTGLLPWFVSAYLQLPARRPLVAMSMACAALLVANLWLPWGVAFTGVPDAMQIVLPWGEQVTDLRVHRASVWFVFGASLYYLVYGWCAWAALREYRAGRNRRSSLTLAACLLLLMLGMLYNHLVNLEWVPGVHLAEFTFIAMVVLLDFELARERRQSRDRVRGMLDHMPAAVHVKLQDGRYLMTNRVYDELFGLASGSAVGRSDADLFPAAQVEAARASDQRVLRNRETVRTEVRIGSDARGAPRIFASLLFPLLDRDGRPEAVCGILTDITDLRQNEREMYLLRRQVWHADRVARTAVLAASLAHELSQPLTAILSNAQAGLRFLAHDPPDIAELREILQDVVRDDKRASAVINGLRTMLRRQETEREQLDVGRCVQEVVDLMHSDFLERGVEVTHSMTPDCMVLGDKGQLQQVVLNLAMNANEAMVEQPRGSRSLHVSVAPDLGRRVRVAIRDSGPGIDADHFDHVFDHFYTTKAKGLGMGLAMCRSILEAHGGSLSVARNEGPGVTFHVLLPRAPQPVAS
ncbi:sensor histidine kinase [Variovorax saccharolyticus]|uniref:sensor histidine kinase n=1 Tax=Variovorax saccharolyticus TaxID=3053516 RepID=UPI002577B793|nr:PAS domain-containing sensor histidine kinase [Variovorax sp. J22R187]MDM0019303.1 PAS domain-containing sensor histidine kinase [Variovorax sp. J22R187]